jgi:VanZ family protein
VIRARKIAIELSKGHVRFAPRSIFALGILLLFISSLLPSQAMPAIGVSDKFEHFCAYGSLMFVGGLSLQLRRSLIAMGIALFFLGIALEMGQAFSPGRSPDLSDAVANTSGILLASIVLVLLRPDFLGHS